MVFGCLSAFALIFKHTRRRTPPSVLFLFLGDVCTHTHILLREQKNVQDWQKLQLMKILNNSILMQLRDLN